MAKRKKSNKLSIVKKFAILGGVLALAQVGYIFYFSGSGPAPVRDAIKEQVSKQRDLGAERRVQLEIQLAVADYQVKNGGKPPASLKDLVPEYFDRIPNNPSTGSPYPYSVVNGRPIVGALETPSAVVSTEGTVLEGTTQSEQQTLVDSLNQDELNQFVYDPAGKRDPFLPFSMAKPEDEDPNKTQLEKYDLGQLKLTAVLNFGAEPVAMVEVAGGQGYPVKKGAKIGNAGGVVVDILTDKVLILETSTDFTGQSKSRTVELKLRVSDTDSSKRNPSARR